MVLFAAISLTTILAVFIRYSWDPILSLLRRRRSNQHHARAFFHTQLGAYIASLMLCNAISSIGMMIDSQWAGAKAVTTGAFGIFDMRCKMGLRRVWSRAGILCNTQGMSDHARA